MSVWSSSATADRPWPGRGRPLVYEEPELQLFRVRADLRVFDWSCATRWITPACARASDVPGQRRTMSSSGRKRPRRPRLVGLDGRGADLLIRTWTRAGLPAGVGGDGLVASLAARRLARRRARGSVSGAVTHHPGPGQRRGPTWTPDSTRGLPSDRDGVSNLYAARVADGALFASPTSRRRLRRMSPRTGANRAASYSARGCDVQVMAFDPRPSTRAPSWTHPAPGAASGDPDRPCQPASLLLPRFWTPYVSRSSGETTIGAVSGGADALIRHAWAADAHYGTGTDRAGGRLFYQYDRFWPTFTLAAEDDSDPATKGFMRTREVTVRATLPLHRTFRAAHSLSLAWRRRRETPRIRTSPPASTSAAWRRPEPPARRRPSPIRSRSSRAIHCASPTSRRPRGPAARCAGKMVAMARLHRASSARAMPWPCIWPAADGGQPGSAVVRGRGLADGALFDVVSTNHSVPPRLSGRRLCRAALPDANVEYRFPLAHPQRGYRLLPVFVPPSARHRVRGRRHGLNEDFRWGDSRRRRAPPSAPTSPSARPAPDLQRGRRARFRGARRDARVLPDRPRLLEARLRLPPLHPFDLLGGAREAVAIEDASGRLHEGVHLSAIVVAQVPGDRLVRPFAQVGEVQPRAGVGRARDPTRLVGGPALVQVRGRVVGGRATAGRWRCQEARRPRT